MELRRLDNVLVWQSGFVCPCPDPRDLTNVIGLGHRSRGYILKGSLGFHCEVECILKRKGKGERDPEGGIGGERDPREWRCGLQKVLSG